ncbi:GFA family protein [Zhengella sp. ZM62]|uniref:GFA family protein n=1 Tax=Zhengella sedimenti TaxID=3390035 RepID=UPI003974F94B
MPGSTPIDLAGCNHSGFARNVSEVITMIPNTAGSCLCGTVRFQISGEFESFFLCHCKRCRKDTGSAFAANLFSSTATVDWVSGRDCIRTYRVPETRHERSFCIKCGSALPTVQSEGALVVVPAGSLDSAIKVGPSAHICFGSRAEWDMRLEDIRKVDGLPG